jgi:hypothetical protein
LFPLALPILPEAHAHPVAAPDDDPAVDRVLDQLDLERLPAMPGAGRKRHW